MDRATYDDEFMRRMDAYAQKGIELLERVSSRLGEREVRTVEPPAPAYDWRTVTEPGDDAAIIGIEVPFPVFAQRGDWTISSEGISWMTEAVHLVHKREDAPGDVFEWRADRKRRLMLCKGYADGELLLCGADVNDDLDCESWESVDRNALIRVSAAGVGK